MLETATLVTPFADAHHLRGQELVIFLAYAARVPYGLALGVLSERGEQVVSGLASYRYPVAATLGGTCVALALRLAPRQPRVSTVQNAGVVISRARFAPQFVRRPSGSCVAVANSDPIGYRIQTDDGIVAVPPCARAELRYGGGVHRVRTSTAPFDGGFIIMDETIKA